MPWCIKEQFQLEVTGSNLMKYRKKNGLYIPNPKPDHYMGCMGLEDPFPPRMGYPKLSKMGILGPGGSGGGMSSAPSAGITIYTAAGDRSTLAWANRTNSTMSAPANVAVGNFLLAALTKWDNAATTPPGGWASIQKLNHSYGHSVELFYYRYASGASWEWVHGNTSTIGFVWRFTGVVASGDPEDCAGTENESGGTDPLSCASITTATAGACLVQVFTGSDDTITWSSETLTERFENTSGANSIAACADLQAGAGASGAKAGTPSGWAAGLSVLIALKPA